jgi:hypothetical protein
MVNKTLPRLVSPIRRAWKFISRSFWNGIKLDRHVAIRAEQRISSDNVERLHRRTHQGRKAGPKYFEVPGVLKFAERPLGVYLRGLPRLANTSPRSSAVHRSELASLRASLRSGPGGI